MSRQSDNRSGQPRSQRQLRVGEELRHALAEILPRHTLNDPVLYDLSITVTEVRVSPDLKNATAFVVPLGGADLPGVVRALNKASAYFRREISGMMNLRSVPRIGFEEDLSFDEADKINQLLHSAHVAQDLNRDEASNSIDFEALANADDDEDDDR
ncbi:30S ribosome-binding factor RbfA [Kiloniella sp. b19]|uniref:30S ribosome-binding factor RbfA n=1 Tax=Kiloniella sp. GXU_MW_B19 TaxID=3141326 RepID=UPI0031E3C38F